MDHAGNGNDLELFRKAEQRRPIHVKQDVPAEGCDACDRPIEQPGLRPAAEMGEEAESRAPYAGCVEFAQHLVAHPVVDDRSPAIALAEGEIGVAYCRDRVCQYGWIQVVAEQLKKKTKIYIQHRY